MLRHIVVEGPDGAGKTTLINKIVHQFGYIRHARASDSTTGPVPDLDQWVINDMTRLATHRPSVFDRHPLISEPIYGPVCRGGVPGKFNEEWWLRAMRARLAIHALVILCLPPFEIVKAQATKEDQMPGVLDNLEQIYDAYTTMHWVGPQIRFDRTKSEFPVVAPLIPMVVEGAQ